MASTDLLAPPATTDKTTEKEPPFWGRPSVLCFGAVLFFLAICPQVSSVSYLDEAKMCFSIFAVTCLFNVMIIVHELGHFLAALQCGMKVEKFAVWFGKPLWSKKINGVEYILGTIPLGGYVALPQMVNPEALEGRADAPVEKLPPIGPLSKMWVAFAGPLCSFLLAVFFAFIVWGIGKAEMEADSTTVIGYVMPDSSAEKSGLKVLDQVVKVGDVSVNKWRGVNGVQWSILFSTTEDLPIQVLRDGKLITVITHPDADPTRPHTWHDRASPRIVGLSAKQAVLVKKVLNYSPGAQAGLKPGDEIVQVNGGPVYAPMMLQELVKLHPNDVLKLTVKRGDQTIQTEMTPEKPEDPLSLSPDDGCTTALGIEWDNQIQLKTRDPYVQITESAQTVFQVLGALFTPHSNIGVSQMNTPIGIVSSLSSILLDPYGIYIVLYFAMAINVNLAIFNLLPLPILDGGHITVSIIELIRRKPTSISVLEPFQLGTVVMFFSLFMYISFFDVQDTTKAVIAGVHKLTFKPIPNMAKTDLDNS